MEAIRRLLMLTAFLLLGACGNTVNDAEYVQHAQDLLDTGDLNSAAIELKNALQQNPQNAQARRLLGVVNLEIGDMPGAEKELRRAEQLGVAGDAVLPLLARALLGQAKYQELDALSLQQLSGALAKAEVLSAQGLGQLVRKEPGEAQKRIDQAIQLSADSTYAGVARAQLLVFQEQYEAAREELDRVLGIDADYAPAWSLLGNLQKSQQELVEAEKSLTMAIDNRQANTGDLLSRTMVRIDLSKYADAQKDVDILVTRVPKHAVVHLAQGLIHLHAKKLEEAKVALEHSLRTDDRQLLPKYYLASIHFGQGNIEQAYNYAEQAFVAAPTSIAVRKLLAAIELNKQEFSRAEELVRPIVAVRKGDAGALDILASALIGQKELDQAVPLLEQLISLQPNSARAELRLGAALLAAGEADQGVAHIEKSLEKDPGFDLARLALVRHLVGQQDIEGALRIAEDYRDNQPGSPEPLNLIGGILLQRGDEQAAVRAFERARGLDSGNPAANHALAALAIREKDYEKARGLYENVLAHRKDDLNTLMKLVALGVYEKNEPEMVGRLRQAVSAHPKAVRPNATLARYYLIKGEPEKVAPLMVTLSPEDKKDPLVLEVMTYAQMAQKRYAEAKFSLVELIKRQPDDPQLHFLLSRAQAGLNDAAAMEQELLKTVALAPKHFAAHLALARLASSRNNETKVQEHLAALETLAPAHPDVLKLKAVVAGVEGDQKQAASLSEKVFEKAPNTWTMLSLARQKWAAGDSVGSVEIQEEWVKNNPGDFLSSLALAGAYAQGGEFDKAIALYEELIQNNASNILALNDLAWYLRDRNPAKALEYAQRAYDLAPESPDIVDTLAMVQLSNGQVERARRSIERALQKAPDNRAIRYHSAVIAEASGDTWEATRLLSELLQDASGFAEREEAERMLQRLRPN